MECLIITASDKAGIYEEILPQIKEITSGESDIVANTANIAGRGHNNIREQASYQGQNQTDCQNQCWDS